MNKEIAKIWVDALRSGKYEQGKYKLRTEDDKFCCLGVLCDLAEKQGIISEPVKIFYEPDAEEKDLFKYYYDNESESLPKSVMKWAGIKDRSGAYSTVPAAWLTLDNDNNGKSFLEIADIIEQHVESL